MYFLFLFIFLDINLGKQWCKKLWRVFFFSCATHLEISTTLSVILSLNHKTQVSSQNLSCVTSFQGLILFCLFSLVLFFWFYCALNTKLSGYVHIKSLCYYYKDIIKIILLKLRNAVSERMMIFIQKCVTFKPGLCNSFTYPRPLQVTSPLHDVNQQLGILLGKLSSDGDEGGAAYAAGSGCLQCLKQDDLMTLIGVVVKGQLGDLQSQLTSQNQQIIAVSRISF